MNREVRDRIVTLRLVLDAVFVVIMAVVSAAVAIVFWALPEALSKLGVAMPRSYVAFERWLSQWGLWFWLAFGLGLSIAVLETTNGIYRLLRYGEPFRFFIES